MHPHLEADDLTFDEEGDDENVAMNNEEAERRSVFHKMRIDGYQETVNMYLLYGTDTLRLGRHYLSERKA